jgi:hypothetical protein
MGLTMSQRQAVTKAIAAGYKQAGRGLKRTILHELCATTGWHRNHPRKALGTGASAQGGAAASAAGPWLRSGRSGGAAVLLGGVEGADG